MVAPLRRIGVLGDIHQEDALLKVALDELSRRDVDRVLSVGDIVDGYGDLAHTLRLLRDAGVQAVRGNHERWLLRDSMRELPGASRLADIAPADREDLSSLPVTRDYATATGPLLLCHGLGDDDMAGVRPDDFGYGLANNTALRQLLDERRYRFVINGHTHRAMVRTIEDLTIINAGTLHRDFDPCFLVVDFEHAKVQRFLLVDDVIADEIVNAW